MQSNANRNPEQNKRKPGRSALLFTSSVAAAFLLTILVRSPGFTPSQNYVLFLLFFSVGLWLTDAVPPFAVGLFIMAFLFFTLGNNHLNPNPVEATKYVRTLSNSVVWLLLGGFFLAQAMTKTGIDVYLFHFSLKLSGKVPANILLGMMVVTMVSSMILSNAATTSMVIASVMPLVGKLGKNGLTKALVVGIPIAATLGGMATIIGSPTNAVAVGALENNGISLDFLSWMVFGIPLSIALTLAAWWLLKKKYILSNAPVEFEPTPQDQQSGIEGKIQRTIVIIIVILTVALWMTSPLHQLSPAAVAAVPLVLLPMSGILRSEDIRKVPWDTLLLVAGGLSLGLGLQDTKLLEIFAGHLKEIVLNSFFTYIIFAYITMIFSNVMSNTAAASILIPLAIYMVPEHKKQITVVIGLAASTSLLLPVSSPPNAIAYGTGFINQKDFLPGGLLVGLLGPLLVVLVVMLIV